MCGRGWASTASSFFERDSVTIPQKVVRASATPPGIVGCCCLVLPRDRVHATTAGQSMAPWLVRLVPLPIRPAHPHRRRKAPCPSIGVCPTMANHRRQRVTETDARSRASPSSAQRRCSSSSGGGCAFPCWYGRQDGPPPQPPPRRMQPCFRRSTALGRRAPPALPQ